MSQRNQHLTDAMLRKLATTTPKQVQTTWCFGEDWQHAGGAIETFNQQPCSPESCHSVTLTRVLLFVKAAPFFAKKVTAAFNATSPVQHVDVCVILPAFCGFMVSGELLQQLGAFRASCRNPKNRIATRSNAWIWRAHFWSRLLLK